MSIDRLNDFLNMFPTNKSCIRYIMNNRWRDGEYCPGCFSVEKIERITDLLYSCSKCRMIFSCETNTVCEKSDLTMSDWLYTLLVIVNESDDSNIPLTEEIGRDLRISYNSERYLFNHIDEFCTQMRIPVTISIINPPDPPDHTTNK